MTRDEAKELIGIHGHSDFDDAIDLVLAAAKRGAEEERDACAKVCDEQIDQTLEYEEAIWNNAAKECAAKIRERSNVEVT